MDITTLINSSLRREHLRGNPVTLGLLEVILTELQEQHAQEMEELGANLKAELKEVQDSFLEIVKHLEVEIDNIQEKHIDEIEALNKVLRKLDQKEKVKEEVRKNLKEKEAAAPADELQEKKAALYFEYSQKFGNIRVSSVKAFKSIPNLKVRVYNRAYGYWKNWGDFYEGFLDWNSHNSTKE